MTRKLYKKFLALMRFLLIYLPNTFCFAILVTPSENKKQKKKKRQAKSGVKLILSSSARFSAR
jgi:hypothetical protein